MFLELTGSAADLSIVEGYVSRTTVGALGRYIIIEHGQFSCCFRSRKGPHDQCVLGGVAYRMTELRNIVALHLHLECTHCGNENAHPVKKLLAMFPPHTTIQKVAQGARSPKCGAKGYGRYTIISVGASGVALDGARQGPE